MKTSILAIIALCFFSCNKAFLDIKPDKELVVPSTLDDMQAMLDYYDVMNAYMPSSGEISSDDYYMLFDRWTSLTQPDQKNGYIWAKDIFEGNPSIDWNNRYQQIFYANNVLEGLEKIKAPDDSVYYNRVKGSALFYRAYAFYQLAQIFCAPYEKSGTNKGYGIPIRLTSDLNTSFNRSTIKETYDQILSDLNNAIPLLPKSDTYKTRPVKTAAYALLARIYLTMQDYDKSLELSDSVITLSNASLLDFNYINPSSSYPMTKYNNEVIFQSTLAFVSNLNASRLIIDSTLYQSYLANDIRKDAWFKNQSGNKTFKGSYDGSIQYFNGLALDECYLNKSECLARKGDINDAIITLNKLLIKRYVGGTFVPSTVTDPQEALSLILRERRKELLYRGIRWSDLRRLNLATATQKTLIRNLNGSVYELKPNSLNYTLPIPENVIQVSGLIQNERE